MNEEGKGKKYNKRLKNYDPVNAPGGIEESVSEIYPRVCPSASVQWLACTAGDDCHWYGA